MSNIQTIQQASESYVPNLNNEPETNGSVQLHNFAESLNQDLENYALPSVDVKDKEILEIIAQQLKELVDFIDRTSSTENPSAEPADTKSPTPKATQTPSDFAGATATEPLSRVDQDALDVLTTLISNLATALKDGGLSPEELAQLTGDITTLRETTTGGSAQSGETKASSPEAHPPLSPVSDTSINPRTETGEATESKTPSTTTRATSTEIEQLDPGSVRFEDGSELKNASLVNVGQTQYLIGETTDGKTYIVENESEFAQEDGSYLIGGSMNNDLILDSGEASTIGLGDNHRLERGEDGRFELKEGVADIDETRLILDQSGFSIQQNGDRTVLNDPLNSLNTLQEMLAADEESEATTGDATAEPRAEDLAAVTEFLKEISTSLADGKLDNPNELSQLGDVVADKEAKEIPIYDVVNGEVPPGSEELENGMINIPAGARIQTNGGVVTLNEGGTLYENGNVGIDAGNSVTLANGETFQFNAGGSVYQNGNLGLAAGSSFETGNGTVTLNEGGSYYSGNGNVGIGAGDSISLANGARIEFEEAGQVYQNGGIAFGENDVWRLDQEENS